MLIVISVINESYAKEEEEAGINGQPTDDVPFILVKKLCNREDFRNDLIWPLLYVVLVTDTHQR